MPDHKFEPFKRVLVRDRKEHKWEIDFFSHNDGDQEFPFCCMCGDFRYCIPYTDETAHLLGTTQPYEPPKPPQEYEWGQKVEVFMGGDWGRALYLKHDKTEARWPHKIVTVERGTDWVESAHIRPLPDSAAHADSE